MMVNNIDLLHSTYSHQDDVKHDDDIVTVDADQFSIVASTGGITFAQELTTNQWMEKDRGE